jgi:hypothetical protein
MTEVSIVESWWDKEANLRDTCRTIVAVYARRAAAEAFVANQLEHAKTNAALTLERDHKHWAITVHEVID